MKQLLQGYLLFFLGLMFFCSGAQNNRDSLLLQFNTTSNADTVRANAFQKYAESFAENNPDTTVVLAEQIARFARSKGLEKQEADAYKLISHSYWLTGDNARSLEYTHKILVIRKKLGDKKGVARCYINMGLLYSNESEYDKAMDSYMKALAIIQETGDKKGLASCYNNMGIVYNNQSDYPAAMSYFLKALNINEKIGNKSAAHNNYINLGAIYQKLGDYSKSEEYFLKALEMAKETGEKKKIGESYANLGTLYNDQGQADRALELIFKSSVLFEEIGYKYGLSSCYTTIGNIYLDKENFHEALDYALRALKIKEEIDDKVGVAICYLNLSSIYNQLGNPRLSIDYAHKAVSLSKEIKDIDSERLVYKSLSDIYAKTRKYKEAYENHLLYKQFSDSIFNKENSRQMSDLKTRFEVEKKELELGAKAELEKSKSEARSAQEKMQRYALYIVLGLTIVFGLFMFKRYKVTRQQKQIIELKNKETEEQKALIEEHQKETIDSINYARRIQFALLASEELLSRNLPEHFMLFKPKDIVSGDFYWAAEHENRFYLAVCDSTGHGVPGAFMSLLNMGFLTQAVLEKGILAPNEILNFVRQRLIESIGGDGRQDGMDAILICIDKTSPQGVLPLITYAAANNGPILIRDRNISEQPKDKMPVGRGEKQDSFTLYRLEYEPGDSLYLYTDGFADQFGGPRGKKFKYRQMNEFLRANSKRTAAQQALLLDQAFATWKGDLEQVDDICIAGIRI